jgi:hypothetical protein
MRPEDLGVAAQEVGLNLSRIDDPVALRRRPEDPQSDQVLQALGRRGLADAGLLGEAADGPGHGFRLDQQQEVELDERRTRSTAGRLGRRLAAAEQEDVMILAEGEMDVARTVDEADSGLRQALPGGTGDVPGQQQERQVVLSRQDPVLDDDGARQARSR